MFHLLITMIGSRTGTWLKPDQSGPMKPNLGYIIKITGKTNLFLFPPDTNKRGCRGQSPCSHPANTWGLKWANIEESHSNKLCAFEPKNRLTHAPMWLAFVHSILCLWDSAICSAIICTDRQWFIAFHWILCGMFICSTVEPLDSIRHDNQCCTRNWFHDSTLYWPELELLCCSSYTCWTLMAGANFFQEQSHQFTTPPIVYESSFCPILRPTWYYKISAKITFSKLPWLYDNINIISKLYLLLLLDFWAISRFLSCIHFRISLRVTKNMLEFGWDCIGFIFERIDMFIIMKLSMNICYLPFHFWVF